MSGLSHAAKSGNAFEREMLLQMPHNGTDRFVLFLVLALNTFNLCLAGDSGVLLGLELSKYGAALMWLKARAALDAEQRHHWWESTDALFNAIALGKP